MLLLPEGQTGKAWEPPNRKCFFGNRGALDGKVLWILKVIVCRLMTLIEQSSSVNESCRGCRGPSPAVRHELSQPFACCHDLLVSSNNSQCEQNKNSVVCFDSASRSATQRAAWRLNMQRSECVEQAHVEPLATFHLKLWALFMQIDNKLGPAAGLQRRSKSLPLTL